MLTTQDPVWCMEELWGQMLNSFQCAVQNKEGLGNKLPDMVKLLELMTNGGPSKWVARPPSFHVDLSACVIVPPEQRAALREVFVYYCRWSPERQRYLHMTRSQFLRFARDTLLISVDMPAVAMESLFNQVVQAWPEEAPNFTLTMLAWMKAIETLAVAMHPLMSLQQAWDVILGEHVFMFAGSSSLLDDDKLGLVLLSPAVMNYLEASRTKLRALFDFYANEAEFCYMYGVQRKRRSPPPAATAMSNTHTNTTLAGAPSLPPSSPGAAQSRLTSAVPGLPVQQVSWSGSPFPSPHRHLPDALAPAYSGGSLDGSPNASYSGAWASQNNAYTGQAPLLGDVPKGWGPGNELPWSQASRPATQGTLRAQSPTVTTAKPPGTSGSWFSGVQPQQQQQLGLPQSSVQGGTQVWRPGTGNTAVSSNRQLATNGPGKISHQMNMPTYMRMLHELGVLPNILNKAQACISFCAARYGPGQCTAIDSLNSAHYSLSFEEFLEAFARCALTAFNYQELPPPKTLMVFKDSYQAGAKHMWAADARTELQDFLNRPNEVAPPPAMYESCIGREDAAHYDELEGGSDARSIVPSPRTARSRPGTAASVRSMASNIYRSAKSLTQNRAAPRKGGGGGGPETLQVHGEADTLDVTSSRPLHLQQFKLSWIGEPQLPLNEVARSRAAFRSRNESSKEMFLPPVFKQHAADMLTARTNHEQAMEALRLMYVSARRRQAQEARAHAAQKREELQLRSMQPRVTQTLSPRV